MELKYYLSLVWHWAWLLLLGLVLGGAVGFWASSLQEPVYKTSTRVQVMSAPRSGGNDYSFWTEQQLAQTYAQTIKTRPMVDAVAEKIGGDVSTGQIRTQTVANTQLIDIFVEDTDPQRAALIANTLVTVFIERNYQIQSERFSESEKSLEAQIQQVDAQIDALQTRSVAASSAETQETIQKTQDEIKRLQTELLALQNEIDTLKFPPRLPGSISTPTPSAETRSQINEKELQVRQLQATYDLYQQIYTNLVVMGQSNNLSNANVEQEQMQSTLALYRQIRANLLGSYEGIRLARLSSTSNIVAIEPAIAPGSPVRPKPLSNMGMGMAIGLVLAGGIVFLIEYLDDTIKTVDQVSLALGLPVLGYIAELEHNQDKAYVSENPRSPVSEAFRTLRTNLGFASVDKPIKSLLIASVHPSDGKTTIATNLAITLSQGGKKVILIDADLRRPRVHHHLDLNNRVGLSDLFHEQIAIQDVTHVWKNKNLGVVTSGGIPPNPADLLASERMAAILESAGRISDIVIVDAPPFLVADASILSSRVDGVLLVLRPGKTPLDAALISLEQMKRAGANVLGVVFNRIPRNQPQYYGGYRYYSSYYHDEKSYYGELPQVSDSSLQRGNGNRGAKGADLKNMDSKLDHSETERVD
jgi:capsular exopolysaccharide synthesis family protein